MGWLLSKKLYKPFDGALIFMCPGCNGIHMVTVEKDEDIPEVPTWQWNGDVEKPTFSPSVNVYANTPSRRCHSFVVDGKITFLNDSFHELKGKTVELGDVSERFKDPNALISPE